MIYKNALIQTFDQLLYGYIVTKDHLIVKIIPGDYDGDEVSFDCERNYLLPGFIDCMVHGGFGHTFTHVSVNDLLDYCKKAPQGGLTSFLPAVITSEEGVTMKALSTIAQFYQTYGQDYHQPICKVQGINCEGPFLSHKRRGVHTDKYLKTPSIEQFEKMQKSANNLIKILAVAIENSSLEFARYLYENHVIMSLAHSNCTFDDVANFVDNGFLRHCTHLFNAMSPLLHRAPGCVGGCLYFDQILCELIADGHHTALATLDLALKVKSAKHLCLTTDGTMCAGMPDGQGYFIGDTPVEKKGTKTVLAGTEDLAGSASLMKDLVYNMGNHTSCTWHDVMLVSSYNIAKQLNLTDKVAKIAPGYFADFVLLNDNFELLTTIVNGHVAYNNLI